MKRIKKGKLGYFYKQNYFGLTKLLESNGVEVYSPSVYKGASQFADRNYCRIMSDITEEELEIYENMYEKNRNIESLNQLIPLNEGLFYQRIQSSRERHEEPLIIPDNIVPIRFTRFRERRYKGEYGSFREIGYINVNKIEIKKNMNIYLPEGWYIFQCIDTGGSLVHRTERHLSEMAGFPVHIHYHYMKNI